jgi:hypothetical protein
VLFQGPTQTGQAAAKRPNVDKETTPRHVMWDKAFQLWDKRNKEIYETDDNNRTLLFDLKQVVQEPYNLEDKVLVRDQNNFALPLNERLTHVSTTSSSTTT